MKIMEGGGKGHAWLGRHLELSSSGLMGNTLTGPALMLWFLVVLEA